MTNKESSYGNIFKTTFLFGFVQVFNIGVKVILNKVVAVLLGAEGLGVIGIYNNVSKMIVTGAGLGINQSSVRDISEANALDDKKCFSRIISVVNKLILLTSMLGVIITLGLSPFLSKWTFGNNDYIFGFVWLSVVVGLNILSEGQLAILKGMRQLRALAKASMFGSLVGLAAAVPFYYFFRRGGIIPSLIVTAFAALFFSNTYVRKIDYIRVKLSIKEALGESHSMIKMGMALMYVTFLGTLFETIVASFISNTGSLADVGYYNAGISIISGYFGIVITSMSTDYYPRISAIHDDNILLQKEMNKQSETGLVIVFPLVVLFVFLSPFFIELLYSKDFIETNDYTDYAMIGTILVVVSNCMGMILLAKQASNIFIWSVLVQRIVLIMVYLLCYKYWGLTGLGFSYIATGALNFFLMAIILDYFYKIKVARRVSILLTIVIFATIATIIARKIDIIMIKYSIGIALFLFSILFSYIYMKMVMNIDMLSLIQKRLKK